MVYFSFEGVLYNYIGTCERAYYTKKVFNYFYSSFVSLKVNNIINLKKQKDMYLLTSVNNEFLPFFMVLESSNILESIKGYTNDLKKHCNIKEDIFIYLHKQNNSPEIQIEFTFIEYAFGSPENKIFYLTKF